MRVLAVIALVALAGCISGEEPVESAEVANASGAAASPAVVPNAEGVADAASAAPTPRDFPVSIQGKTGMYACLPSGPTSCTIPPAASIPGENTWIEAEYDGVIRSGELTLTWSATTPATSEMYVMLLGVKSCGENCYETDDTTFRAMASGTSPVALSAADITLQPEETLWIHVGFVRPTPPVPAPFFYSLEQAFALEGKLVAMVEG